MKKLFFISNKLFLDTGFKSYLTGQMIGFFDSGFGGLTILKEVEKLLPDYSYVYLGDNLRTPYGSRTKEEIFKYTKEGVKKLFEQGARLVILACNTSSAVALRRMQKEWLPKKIS